jgi:hypothetical protein
LSRLDNLQHACWDSLAFAVEHAQFFSSDAQFPLLSIDTESTDVIAQLVLAECGDNIIDACCRQEFGMRPGKRRSNADTTM